MVLANASPVGASVAARVMNPVTNASAKGSSQPLRLSLTVSKQPNNKGNKHMDIKEFQEALKLSDVAEAFKASCDAKTKFFDQLRGVVTDLAPSIVKKAELTVEDFELSLKKYNEQHKYDNYQFRYNKKYTTTVIFVPDGKTNIGVHDNLVFKGRKSDKPEYLVFEVSHEVAEGEAAPEPFKVELLESLFIEWLKFGLIH